MSGNISIEKQGPYSKEAAKIAKRVGRPPKARTWAEDEPQLLFRREAAAAFRKAKLDYEKTQPFELTNAQFMMLLITAFSENK